MNNPRDRVVRGGGSLVVSAAGAIASVAAAGSGSGVTGSGYAFTTGAGGGGAAAGGDFTINLGAPTGAGAAGSFKIVQPVAGRALDISVNGIDPWFHINNYGVGAVGDGVTIPYIASESDSIITSGIRMRATTAPQGVLEAWSATGALPVLQLTAPDDIWVRAGTSAGSADATKKVRIMGTNGVTFETWAGVVSLTILAGNMTWAKGASYTLAVADSTAGGATGSALTLKAGAATVGGGGDGAHIVLTPGLADGAGSIGLVQVSAGGLRIIAGNLGIGTGPSTAIGVTSGGLVTAGVSQYGYAWQGTFSSSGVTSGTGLYARVTTAAAAFTMATGYGLYVESPVVGAGSAITAMYGGNIRNQGQAGSTSAIGLNVLAQSGSTNNYNLFLGNFSAPGGNWSLYSNSTNASLFAGDVRFTAGALAMTAGFLYIPGAAGAPTGVPAIAGAGLVPLYFDQTGKFLYIYSGGSWLKSTVYA